MLLDAQKPLRLSLMRSTTPRPMATPTRTPPGTRNTEVQPNSDTTYGGACGRCRRPRPQGA
eukprot:4702222-Prymnesium_polylepis.1